MAWPDDIAAELPPSRDDEPPSLRDDVVDELTDHLVCSANRELLAGRNESDAHAAAIERFGDPARLARQLWLESMKGTIMTRRLKILLAVAASLALVAAMLGIVHEIDTLRERNAGLTMAMDQLRQAVSQAQAAASQAQNDIRNQLSGGGGEMDMMGSGGYGMGGMEDMAVQMDMEEGYGEMMSGVGMSGGMGDMMSMGMSGGAMGGSSSAMGGSGGAPMSDFSVSYGVVDSEGFGMMGGEGGMEAATGRAAAPAAVRIGPDTKSIAIERGTIVRILTGRPPLRVHLGDRTIVEAQQEMRGQHGVPRDQIVVLKGLREGNTRMHLKAADGLFDISINVRGKSLEVAELIGRLYPDSSVEVVYLQDSIVLRGTVPSDVDFKQILEIAEQFYPKVLNQLVVAPKKTPGETPNEAMEEPTAGNP